MGVGGSAAKESRGCLCARAWALRSSAQSFLGIRRVPGVWSLGRER